MRSPFFFFGIVLLPMFVLSPPPAVCAPLSLSMETTFVTTIAGSAGDNGYSDGIGSAALFNKPSALAVDGRMLYIADSGNHTIRKMDLATGAVTTLAGTVGEAASIVRCGDGLYVVENGRGRIRKLTSNAKEKDTDPQRVSLELRPRGATKNFGQNQMEAFSTRLNGLKKEPGKRPEITRLPSLMHPVYGSISFGKPLVVIISHYIIDITPDGKMRLYFDTNANGDFKDDPPAEWETTVITNHDGKQYVKAEGGAWGGTLCPARLTSTFGRNNMDI